MVWLAALAAPAFAQTGEHEQMEHRTGMAAADAASPPAPTDEFLQILNDAEAKELTIALGPIDLPAGVTHHELRQLPVQVGHMPFDFTIRGYRAEAIDRHGARVPQTIIHHLNLLDPASRELFQPIMRRVLAASHETPPTSVPGWLLGIPIRAGTEFLALTMLHNPTSESYEGVSIRLVIQYERSETLPVYTMYPFHIDVLFPTGSKAFDLPPGKSERWFEGSPAVAGAIVGLGGHMHRYATELELEDRTTGQTLYLSRPVYDDHGHLEEVPAVLHHGRGIGHPIFPDHVYRVTVRYDNPTGEVIPGGGMGSVAGAFIPEESWPAADRTDPIYVADYEWVLISTQHGDVMQHQHGASSGDDHDHDG